MRVVAQPLVTLTRRPKQRPPVRAILDLISRHGVTEVVVGLPLTPEGEEGDAARAARSFGEAIARRSGLPVWFLDERMTTARAAKAARVAGVPARRARSRLDQMAAVGILQAWLERTGGRGDRGTGGRAGEDTA